MNRSSSKLHSVTLGEPGGVGDSLFFMAPEWRLLVRELDRVLPENRRRMHALGLSEPPPLGRTLSLAEAAELNQELRTTVADYGDKLLARVEVQVRALEWFTGACVASAREPSWRSICSGFRDDLVPAESVGDLAEFVKSATEAPAKEVPDVHASDDYPGEPILLALTSQAGHSENDDRIQLPIALEIEDVSMLSAELESMFPPDAMPYRAIVLSPKDCGLLAAIAAERLEQDVTDARWRGVLGKMEFVCREAVRLNRGLVLSGP